MPQTPKEKYIEERRKEPRIKFAKMIDDKHQASLIFCDMLILMEKSYKLAIEDLLKVTKRVKTRNPEGDFKHIEIYKENVLEAINKLKNEIYT
jgi:hypothetical protein